MTPSMVLFAIQSALKLGGVVKQHYVDSARSKAITLPLLNFDHSDNNQDAFDYFQEDATFVTIKQAGLSRLLDIMTKLRSDGESALDKAEQELLIYYYWKDDPDNESVNKTTTALLSDEALETLLTIRQYSKDNEPSTSVFRRMGGTFLEIGVDFFAHNPKGFTIDSREAIALQALFIGLDDVQFSQQNWQDHLDVFPRRLSIALLDIVTEHTDVFSGDATTQQLISATTTALSKDINKQFNAIQQQHHGRNARLQRQRVVEWGEVIFRSVLTSAGRMVAEEPETFLGLDSVADATLFSDLSSTLLDIVLGTETIDLGHVFSKNSLERLIKTSLAVIGKHPELVADGEQGIKALIGQTAAELSKLDSTISRTIFPEAIRLIIKNSGKNMPLLWPDSTIRPEKQALMIATKELLQRLSAQPVHGTWKLVFHRENMAAMLKTTLSEVAKNPAWVIDGANNKNAYLGSALQAMLDVIRDQGDQRLNVDTAQHLLQTGLRAAALRLEFLDELPNGQPIIGAVYDAIVTPIMQQDTSSKAAWRLVRGEVLYGVTQIALRTLQDTDINHHKIKALRTVMNHQITAINAGQPWDLDGFAWALEKSLNTTSSEDRLQRIRVVMDAQIRDINAGKPWSLDNFGRQLERALV
jgi:hypothetical protein